MPAETVSEKYAPRTIAIVALVSLVAGFLIVFGGGMLVLRPTSRETTSALPPLPPVPPPSSDGGTADPTTPAASGDGGAAGATATGTATAAGVTVGPGAISRCFDQGPPAPIPGTRCGALTGFDAHFQARAEAIARCARPGAHGRLSLYMDFRFSTQFLRAWGLPSSNIPDPGGVSVCVRNAISPLPFANIPHDHDRYVLIMPVEW